MVEPATRSGEVFSFGPFCLSASARLLTRDGAEIRLSSRALDLLIRLVAHPNEPLGKRELLVAIWPDQTVGEASLRFHMANLRKALGDGQDGARYIITLSGRGYCFVAPVSRVTSHSSTGNLPQRPPLIGRDEDLAEVAELLGRERLVTIVGPGGVGKTRLAIAAGQRLAEAFPDGVWWVDLAPLTEPSLVVSTVATALDLARGGSQVSTASIVSALRDRTLMLILDNCEYLVGSTAELAEALVKGVGSLTILSTSQESLRLDAERVYRLDPLELPPPDGIDVAGYGAVQLFAYRTIAADRRFDLNASNAGAVADICRRLDGVPLSLEMAAARVPSLGIEGLRASLEARLQVLSTGLRTADVRHQSLRGMAEWSVGLLDQPEAQVFRRLGVFPGSFSLDAAMAIVGVSEMDRWAVADAIARLVDKSVVALESSVPPRYRLLETLRLYARELLQRSGEWERLAKSHALHFSQVLIPAGAARETTPETEWHSIFLPELDNLRSALDWALADPSRFDQAVELGASIGFFWYDWGLIEEGRRFFDSIVERIDDHPPSVAAASVLRNSGKLLSVSADYEAALRSYERALAISRQLDDVLGLAKGQLALADHQVHYGRYPIEAAAALMEGVREALWAGGQKRSLTAAMTVLAVIAMQTQKFDEAVDALRFAAELAGQLKNVRLVQLVQISWALLEFNRGDLERAIEIGRETVSIGRGLPRTYRETALENYAMYLVAANRIDEARPVAEEALSLCRGRPQTDDLLRHLQQWALIAVLDGQDLEAARVIGWVDAAYERLEAPRNMWEVKSYARLLTQLKSRLADAELSAHAAEGARWDADQAVSFTFERIIRREAGQGA
jgi:predicted ATPase/DNA-binding winged helix-turn-helix (wHTH) protein